MELPASGLPWSVGASGLRLSVRVTPRAGRDALDGIAVLADGRPVLRVKVRAVASEGQANDAVTALLAKLVGLPRSRIALVSGASARLKLLELEGEAPVLAARLAALAGAAAGPTQCDAAEP